MPDLPLLPFLDPDRLTWKEREETEQEANRHFSMGKLIPLGALACEDKKRLWGFYVEQPRARYVYVFDFEIEAGGQTIRPIGELYRVPRIRFTPPPGFEPCELYASLYEEGSKPYF
jgi:hypothetical protein